MSKEWWGTPPQEKSALPVSSESMFNFVSTLVLICFLLPISASAGRQMSYQVPQKVKRQSKRHFSTARFSHPLHDSAAQRWDFCSGCALSQDCHSSIWQRRKGCWGRFELWCTTGASSWVSFLPQQPSESTTPPGCSVSAYRTMLCSRMRSTGTSKDRESCWFACWVQLERKQLQGKWENVAGQRAFAAVQKCQIFLMETPFFFMGTESLCS